MFSLFIPVYKNAENIPSLFEALVDLSTKLATALEVVFVVDGSPDDSYLRPRERLPTPSFQSQLLTLSRNFFGGLNCLGTGFLGGYLWRTFENSKRRLNYVIRSREVLDGAS